MPPPEGSIDMTTLNDSLIRLGDMNAAMLKALEKIEKQGKTKGKQDERDDRRSARVSKSIYAISDTVPLIGKLMRSLGGTFKTSFKESFEIQKRGLARGVQLTGMNKEMDPTVEGLSHLTDKLTASQIGMARFEAGMRGSNSAMDRLALQIKLTGGNEKKLLKDLAQNTAGMGMSNEAMFQLAERTQGLAQTFNLTTEEMVGAMNGLGKDLNDLAALGLGADYMEAVATLTAGLGPEMAHLAPEVLKALSSGSNMIQNSMLGGAEKISALTAGQGDTSRVAIEAMLQMGDEAKRISQNYTQGAHHQRFAMDLFKKVHGEQAVLYMRAAEQFRQEARSRSMSDAAYTQHLLAQQKISDNYADTWANFQRHVMEPFFSSMLYVVAALTDFVVENKAWISPLIKVLGVIASITGFALILQQGFRMFKAGVAALTFGKFGAGGAAAVAQQAAPKPGGGFLTGLGKGLSGLAKGLRSMGSKTAMKGAVTIMILAAALIPLAAAMLIFSQVGDLETMFYALFAGLGALALMAKGMAILAPVILPGVAVLWALVGVILAMAIAVAIASTAMTPFFEAVSKLTFENASAVAIMAVSLGALAVALGYFGIVGWLGVAALWAFGSKVQDLAEHAPKLTKMANSLQLLPKAMSSFKDSVGQLTGGPLETLTSQLAGVREEIELLADQNSALVALGTFSKALTDQAATKATADSRSAATSASLNRILIRQEKILEQIEENTEATAGNTQRKIGSLPSIDKKP